MSLNICQYLKKFQSSSWLSWKVFIILTVIISGCSESLDSIQQRIVASQPPPSRDRNSPQYYELKSKSVYDGDTFRVINPITQEEIKIRMACIDAV
jgi:endonuclease YncB( thermonuclease family)